MISTFIKWLGLFAAMYLLQSTVVTQISIAGVQPDLLMLVLFFCAIKTEAIPAVFAGFFIGLAQDFYSPEILGQNALAKTIAGFFTGLFNEKVMRLDPLFQILLLALMFVLHDVAYFTIQIVKTGVSFEAIGMELLTSTLPRMLYTLFFALVPIFKELVFPSAVRR